MRMRFASTAALAAVLGLLAFMPATATKAQVLEVAVDGSPAGLDPHIITAFNSFQIVNGTIYEALTQIDKDLRTAPALAESWTVAQDGKSYSFKLRSNVTFHDGSKMEAADVVASINRVLSKDIASPLASRIAAVDKVTAKDATTVEITLKEASAPFLTQLASIAIVPRSFEHNKDALQRQPIG
ncbi:MAG: ABC transporter substrate-binding protein, partial [Hyphomicrobiales bacterium]